MLGVAVDRPVALSGVVLPTYSKTCPPTSVRRSVPGVVLEFGGVAVSVPLQQVRPTPALLARCPLTEQLVL
jgi:hypothetical protein